MALARHKTIKEALEFVASNPDWPADSQRLDSPVWEIVARNLFEIANNPDTRVAGSMNRATKAQRIIMDRLTGTRRAGTHPAVRGDNSVTFRDLTKGAIETPEAPSE